MTTMLNDFLLFDYNSWSTYNQIILKVAQHAIYPIFVFALLIDRFLEHQNPGQILKRVLIAQIILVSMPIYYKGVVGFGFNVGNELLSKQTKGLVANWSKITKRVENQMKKKPETLDVIKAFFSFDGTSIVEKMAATLIFICVLLLKVIYSVVYYGTYSAIPILSLLSIFPRFENHLQGAFKSILFLIIEVILVAFVLLFMSETISFGVNEGGFITGIVACSKFLVLIFILLGTLKMTHSLVNGSGVESWAGNMGQMLGAGLAYKSMGIGTDRLKRTGEGLYGTSKEVLKTGASGLFRATAPIQTGAGILLDNANSSLKESTHYINKRESASGKTPSSAEVNSYALNFKKIASNSTGRISNASAISPTNHLKATYQTGKNEIGNIVKGVKNRLGLPEYSKNLSVKEKTIFMAKKLVDSKLTRQEQIQNGVIANKISNSLEENNGKN